MKEELMTEVMQQMPFLDNAQLKQLRQVMERHSITMEVTGAEARPEGGR